MKREFHITNLPQDIVKVKLTNDFLNNFFKTLQNYYSNDFIAWNFGISADQIQSWIWNKNLISEDTLFISLDKLQYLSNLLLERNKDWSGLSEFEPHIDALTGYGSSGILNSPKFPIVEDENLVRLVVHLHGDGSLPLEYGTSCSPQYTNSNPFLRNQFLMCLANVFGDVSHCTREFIDNSGHGRSYVAFAQWIGYLLRFWYPDARFDEKSGSLPEVFFQLPLDLKAEMVRTFGDDDGHVGAHCIRFTSGGSMILEQMRGLIVELMEATLSSKEFKKLVGSVGVVKAFRSWFILDLYRPLFEWYAEYVGFSHPERAERLVFQLACDQVWGERGLDGFDLDFLTLVGLRVVGSVGEVARRFMVREDFLFEVFQRLWKLGWIEGVAKRKFTTVYRSSKAGEMFLARVFAREWTVGDRVVMEQEWWERLRDKLLSQYGGAAEMARVVGMPEMTVRGYLQGRRQWMHARWVVALAGAVGWSRVEVSEGVVVAFSKKLAPRYEQCDFLGKVLEVYEQFSRGEVDLDEWLRNRRREVRRREQLLDAGFAAKLQTAGAIRRRIIELAKRNDGVIALAALKLDSVLQELVRDRYSTYLADRMSKLVLQGVFVRVGRGRYQLVQTG